MAIHESGHALVAALSPHADPVAKVTILPSGQALGVTEQLPLVEHHLYGEDYLNESLAVRLGGRAAELVVLGQGSTGAANDLASATDLATKMVREYGLSSDLGPVGYPAGGSVFLGGGGPGMPSRPYAEATQAAIDGEVSKLLRQAEERAVNLLKTHRGELDSLVSLLLERETVDGSDVYRLTGQPGQVTLMGADERDRALFRLPEQPADLLIDHGLGGLGERPAGQPGAPAVAQEPHERLGLRLLAAQRQAVADEPLALDLGRVGLKLRPGCRR